ncbi:MAG: hypothetical protein U0P46_09840 [Holophagaceae bacterium]
MYGEPETHLVSLSVKRLDQAPAWRAEFKDGTRADITAEDIPGLTVLKWKVDPARMKTLTTDPFRLQISNGKATYDTTVSFRSAGRDVLGHALWQVVVRLVVGR